MKLKIQVFFVWFSSEGENHLEETIQTVIIVPDLSENLGESRFDFQSGCGLQGSRVWT